jgi:hypothetical protein
MNLLRSVSALAFAFALCVAGSAPAAAQVAILTDGVQERAARSGESYEGSIRLQNTTAQAMEVSIYLTDYQFNSAGQSFFGTAGELPRSNARWVRLDADRLVLAPHAEGSVGYHVDVPASDSLTGSYWSMVMVEAAPATAKDPGTERTLSIQTRVRHGIQLVSHLGGGVSEARFDALRMITETGEPRLECDLVNAGDVAWHALLTLELYDGEGKLVLRRSAQRGILYAGSSIRQAFALDGLATGTYRALLLADVGAEQTFGTQFRVTVPAR